MRRRLRAQSAALRDARSRRIRAVLYRFPAFRKARCVLIYVSKPEEVDTRGIIRRCLGLGKRVAAPRVGRGGRLQLREVRDFRRDLEPGAFGVLEPQPGRTRPVAAREIDCAILPGLAFDRSGRRLGRGRGYFDRLAARLGRSAVRVALAFPFQIVERIPTAPHDQSVDVVVTAP
jgi:5-formyltetrahydrofolate cyclo-ligase